MKKKPAPKKQKIETIKLTISELDAEGTGIVQHEGKTALVPGALAGETVVAAVEHVGRTHIYTHLTRVLRQSQQRSVTNPDWLKYLDLGSPLIHMTYAAQLQFKQQLVKKALHQYNPLKQLDVPGVLPSEPPMGYRASAKLVFGRKREKVSIGMYKRGSHDVIDCPDCPVHHPLINKIAEVVRDEVQRQKLSVYDPRHKRGLLRYLLVRVSPSANKALVTFVSNDRDLKQLPALTKWLVRRVPEVIGVHENINSTPGNVILGDETLKLQGHPDLIEHVGPIKLRISPQAFFQINIAQATRIYSMVREWAKLGRRDTAIDLFCGIGGIALHLAQDAGQVYGVEYVKEAVRNASENATLNQLRNTRFFAGDAQQQLVRLPLNNKAPELITLNPPRKGCDESLLRTLLELQPKQIIYVSCDPETLARDLSILCADRYRVERLQPVDMFPQTPHVETVVQLRRNA